MGGIHYKSGNFNIDTHDKGTRLQNIPTITKHRWPSCTC